MKGFCKNCEHWDANANFEIHYHGLLREFKVSHPCTKHFGRRTKQNDSCWDGFKAADHMISTRAR